MKILRYNFLILGMLCMHSINAHNISISPSARLSAILQNKRAWVPAALLFLGVAATWCFWQRSNWSYVRSGHLPDPNIHVIGKSLYMQTEQQPQHRNINVVGGNFVVGGWWP